MTDWIDVNDRLPGDDTEYENVIYECMVTVELDYPDPEDDRKVQMLCYNKRDKQWCLTFGQPYNWGWKVVAWAVIPEPYMGETNGI